MADLDLSDLFPTTPQQQQMGLAQALRGQSQGPDFGKAGLLASLSGDRVLAPFGHQALQYAGQQQERQGQLLQRLMEQKRNDQLAQFHADEVNDRKAQLDLQREEMNRSRYRPFIDPTSGRSGILDSWTGQLANGASAPAVSGGATAPGGASGAAAGPGTDMNPYPVGSRPFKQFEQLAQGVERTADIAHLPASYQQDVLRLQLGQNLQGAIQQAQAGGWSKPLRSLVAGELQKLVNGVAGTESELHSIAANAGIGGGLTDIFNGLTGDMTGPQLAAYTKFVTDFAGREHALAQNRLGGYLDSTLSGGNAELVKEKAPKRLEKIRSAALQRLSGLGEIKSQSSGDTPPANNDAAPTHYLVSPDKKMRIAAGPDGKPLPGAAPEPVNG